MRTADSTARQGEALSEQGQPCPLCSAVIDPASAACAPSCPLARGCSMVCCPSCGYSFPKPTGLAAWLSRVFQGRRQATPRSNTLADVAAGNAVRVTGVVEGGNGRLSKLAAFGIVEGCELRVRQRHPALLVEIGETTLALDRDVARTLLVVRAA